MTRTDITTGTELFTAQGKVIGIVAEVYGRGKAFRVVKADGAEVTVMAADAITKADAAKAQGRKLSSINLW